MTEILKQAQFEPSSMEKQVLIIYAGTSGVLDDLPVTQLRKFEIGLHAFMANAHPSILPEIREKKALSDDLKKKINTALAEFKTRFVAENK